jgi:hypothetical protein
MTEFYQNKMAVQDDEFSDTEEVTDPEFNQEVKPSSLSGSQDLEKKIIYDSDFSEEDSEISGNGTDFVDFETPVAQQNAQKGDKKSGSGFNWMESGFGNQ